MTGASKYSLRADVRNLAGKSLIYGLGSVLLRSISVLVLPLYTRYLTPEDYGIVALGSTLTALLSHILPLSLYSAVGRFFFLVESAADRRRMIGTIWLAMSAIGLVVSLALDFAGARLFEAVFPQLPFDPYVRIAIWTAFLVLFSFVPLTLFQAQERAEVYVWWTAATLLITVGLTIVCVVFLELGAYGYLLATLIANAVLVLPYLVVMLRHADLCIDPARLKTALAFSLPLVPHGLAGWVLNVSDRAILQFYVTVSALGLYSLGYTFGMIQIMISGAIGNAWFPFVFKRVAEEGNAAEPRLARLATYYILAICAVSVGLCLFARDAIYLLTTEPFHPAHEVVPIIVIAYLWNGLYTLPQNVLFLKSKTAWIPLATVAAATVNVAMNFALVPRYGIMAAAWATFAAFFVMFVILFVIAHRVSAFPYEYRRIMGILGAAAVVISAGLSVNLSLYADILLKAVILLLFPLALLIGGFLTSDERIALGALARRAGTRLRRTGAAR